MCTVEITVYSLAGCILLEGVHVPVGKRIIKSLKRFYGNIFSTKPNVYDKLVTASGQLVEFYATPYDLTYDTEDGRLCLTLVRVTMPKIYATDGAFCALSSSGVVTTWGARDCGGDCSRCQDKLNEIVAVWPNRHAFSALTSKGEIIAWGDPLYGGDTTIASDENNHFHTLDDTLIRSDVIDVCATWSSFLALRSDGQIFSWGYTVFGSHNVSVEAYLKDKKVERIAAGVGSYIVLLSDQKAVYWHGSEVDYLIIDSVLDVFPQKGPHTNDAVFLKRDGTIAMTRCMDCHCRIVNCNTCKADVSLRYSSIFAGMYSFVGIVAGTGEIRCWGERSLGGDCSSVDFGNSDVTKIVNSWGALAALKKDGSVSVWGSTAHGAEAPPLLPDNIVDIISGDGADGFVAITRDNTAVAWGNGGHHKDHEKVIWPATEPIHDVKKVVCGGHGSFVLIFEDGDLMSWGLPELDRTFMANWEIDRDTRLAIMRHGGAHDVTCTHWHSSKLEAFACLCLDGNVVTWGCPSIVAKCPHETVL